MGKANDIIPLKKNRFGSGITKEKRRMQETKKTLFLVFPTALEGKIRK
jgi:hypothetical protein